MCRDRGGPGGNQGLSFQRSCVVHKRVSSLPCLPPRPLIFFSVFGRTLFICLNRLNRVTGAESSSSFSQTVVQGPSVHRGGREGAGQGMRRGSWLPARPPRAWQPAPRPRCRAEEAEAWQGTWTTARQRRAPPCRLLIFSSSEADTCLSASGKQLRSTFCSHSAFVRHLHICPPCWGQDTFRTHTTAGEMQAQTPVPRFTGLRTVSCQCADRRATRQRKQGHFTSTCLLPISWMSFLIRKPHKACGFRARSHHS